MQQNSIKLNKINKKINYLRSDEVNIVIIIIMMENRFPVTNTSESSNSFFHRLKRH